MGEFEMSTLRICHLLCKAAPKSVMIEVDGVSVIESAIEGDADFEVVRILQSATEYVQKDETYQANSALAEKQVLQALRDMKFQSADKSKGAPHGTLGHRRVNIMAPEMKQYNSKMA